VRVEIVPDEFLDAPQESPPEAGDDATPASGDDATPAPNGTAQGRSE
jgi:hypothetical protein